MNAILSVLNNTFSGTAKLSFPNLLAGTINLKKNCVKYFSLCFCFFSFFLLNSFTVTAEPSSIPINQEKTIIQTDSLTISIQDKRISLKANQTNLGELLSALSTISGIPVIFDDRTANYSTKITMSCDDKPLAAILQLITEEVQTGGFLSFDINNITGNSGKIYFSAKRGIPNEIPSRILSPLDRLVSQVPMLKGLTPDEQLANLKWMLTAPNDKLVSAFPDLAATSNISREERYRIVREQAIELIRMLEENGINVPELPPDFVAAQSLESTSTPHEIPPELIEDHNPYPGDLGLNIIQNNLDTQ